MKTAERMIQLRQLTDRQLALLHEQTALHQRLIKTTHDLVVIADQIHTAMIEHLTDAIERAQ